MLKKIIKLISFGIIFSINVLAGELTLFLENDIFYSDKYYTHGTRIQYIDNLTGYSVGQYIFTPMDTKSTELQINDRPYAGLLYGSQMWLYPRSNKGSVYSTISVMDKLELTIGLVGKYSGAEQLQNFTHKYIADSNLTMGWDHQLNQEIVFGISYNRRYIYETSPYTVVVNKYGLTLGTLYSFTNWDLTLNIGRNIRGQDHQITNVEPIIRINKDELSVYGFVNSGFRLVGRNMFLDGNTWSTSHSVEKRVSVWDFTFGLVLRKDHYGTSLSRSYRSREFKQQPNSTIHNILQVFYEF